MSGPRRTGAPYSSVPSQPRLRIHEMKSPVGSGTGSHLAGSSYRDRMSDIDITRDAEIILTCPACGLMRQLPRNWRNHLGSLAADRDGHLRCSSGHEPVVMTEPADPALVARLAGIQFGIEISDEASCAIAAAVLGCHDGEMSVDHLVADEVWGRAPVDRLRE